MYFNIKVITAGILLCVISFSLQANLKDLETLIQNERYQDAYQLGGQLFTEEAGNPNFDMLFGIAAQRTGEYDHALFAFERVLMYDSKLQVARFELARTHFALGNLMVARRHFNLVIDSDPQPPAAVKRRIQWYLAAINAKEAGKAVAASDAVTRLYVGARLGYESNPSNYSYHDKIWGMFETPKIKSDTLHELQAGFSHYQQQADNWGWFAGANVNFKNYHDNTNEMGDVSLGLQGGGILLGEDWRLSLPIQLNKQQRDDGNEVLVLAVASEFNQRINSKIDYTAYGQLAYIDFGLSNPASASRDTQSVSGGVSYSYRINEKLRLNAGPLVGIENAATDIYSRNLLGVRAGADYAFNDEQRLELNLSGLSTKHKEADFDPAGNKKRSDKQTSAAVKYSHRYLRDWLFDVEVKHSHHSSNFEVYSYRSTQVSAGVRKEW